MILYVFIFAFYTTYFYSDIYMPIFVSATTIIVVGLHLLWLFRKRRIGVLTLLFYAVYILPFIHVFPYLWYDFSSLPPENLWGLAVNPYTTNKTIIELMSMLGATGAIGFIVGSMCIKGNLNAFITQDSIKGYRKSFKSLNLTNFILWSIVAVAFTWISSPQESLFGSNYTQSIAINHNWNFTSAWMVSYSIIMFVLADSMFEVSPFHRKLKRQIVLFSLFLIVVWFQLLRGDRESLTLVVSVVFMYFIWGVNLKSNRQIKTKQNWSMIIIMALFVFTFSYFIGITRQSLTDVDSISSLLSVVENLVDTGEIRIDNMVSGTWSAVLLTPLSVAGDHVNGSLAIKYGQTYVDLLGSIIPGFVADWIGYTRPITGNQGPAWDMRYGIGGTHALVVPFMNFRIIGVFFILGLWGYVFTKIEHTVLKNMTVSNLALLGMIALCLPHWLWYGEKYIMNIIVLWFGLSFIYRLRMINRVLLPPSTVENV